MRLALIHYSAPPVIGGVERVLKQQAEVLARKGHEVVVVCATKGAKVTGAIMEYAPNFYVKRVLSALAGCEVVMVHNMFTMPFNWDASQTLALISREMTSTRFINWVHDVDVTREAFAGLQLRASHVAVSESRRTGFCAMSGLKAAQCAVIRNGVDVPATLGLSARITEMVSKQRLLERELVLFHPARLLARKNIEFDIEITAALRKQGVDAACVITGAPDPHRPESAEYASKMQALIVKRKLQGQVICVGEKFEPDEADVRGLYALADAVLLPSRAEGFGLPLLEGALHRLPVICSDIPAHRELADGHAIFFKLTEDAGAVAKRISAVVARDPAALRRREVIRRFGWDGIYKECLEPLLKGR